MQPASDLQKAYEDATRPNGLINLTRIIREPEGKYNIRKSFIYDLFSNLHLWEELKTKSGHIKFKNKITHTVIGYQNHGDDKLDPGGAVQILDHVQNHLNTLFNDVFNYKTRNWKQPPNFKVAERNLTQWKNNNNNS